jgi:hypothetical protein
MKSYPTKQSMPQRMARKRMRRDVFVANKKAAKARRKSARLARQQETGE